MENVEENLLKTQRVNYRMRNYFLKQIYKK